MLGFFKKSAETAPLSKGRYFDFPGGVHPPENKKQSSDIPIRTLPMPESLVLPLGMHIGAPAKPCVAVGDAVRKGQRIALAQGFISAHVHAPASGVIQAIEMSPVAHASGLEDLCMVLSVDAQSTETDYMPPIDAPLEASPEALIARIYDAGINGLGGAGFPTNVKVSAKRVVDTFIINAVECEPYITADDRLMRERAEGIVQGIAIVQRIVASDASAGLKKTLIGIEGNKPEAIKALQKAIAAHHGQHAIDVIVVPTKYPSGGEKQLIQNLTNKEVPNGQLPADIGVLCMNVGTLFAINRAVTTGEPLISRITTLTGDAMGDKGNIDVLIGTPIRHVMMHANVDEARLSRLVMGGPMMGFTLTNYDVPIVKTTNCLIAGTTQELPQPEPEQPCIRCGECDVACPASLLPQQLYWHSKHREFEKAEALDLMDCIECGACAFVCPSHIPLVQYYRYAKGEVRNIHAEALKADKARERFEFRKARLEKEQAEKEARRKARLEKSKKKTAGKADGEQDAQVKALKKAMLSASQDYKNAVKAYKAADAAGADDAEALRLAMEAAKAKAAEAKEAVRQANAGERAAEMSPLEQKQKQLVDMAVQTKTLSQAVKALDEGDEKTTKAAELAKLQEQMAALKAEVKTLKAQAKTELSAGSSQDSAAAAAQAKLEAELKQAKADAAKAQKVLKEAKKAFDVASKAGAENVTELTQQIEALQANADSVLAHMMDLQKQVKAAKKQADEAANQNAASQNAAADTEAAFEAQLKQAKADAAKAQKVFKEAKKALDVATQAEADNLSELTQQVEILKQQADDALAVMMTLQQQKKAAQNANKEAKA